MAGDEEREAARELIGILRDEFTKPDYHNGAVTLCFSGGLDSSLLAMLAIESLKVHAVVAGAPDSKDIHNARAAARAIGIDAEEIVLDEESVLKGARSLSSIADIDDPLTISMEMPFFSVIERTRGPSVMTGQGADELFGGYAKYRGLTDEEFASLRNKDLRKLVERTSRIERRVASHFRKSLLRPYLCDGVTSFASRLPVSTLKPEATNKPVIRQALVELGLPEIARMEKKAAQYGSGVTKILRKAAKREGVDLSRFFSERRTVT